MTSSARIENPSTWPQRLMIAIPCAELGYTQFWQMLHTIHGYGWHVQNGFWSSHSGSYIHDTHIRLAKDALSVPGWDRLLWLEHDHEFLPDMLYRHSHYKEPVVSGLYTQRRLDDPMPVIFNWDDSRTNALRVQPMAMKEMLEKPGLHEVDIVPMGCTSIRRDVLEDWPEDTPMFFSPVNPLTGRTMSDDVWFCRHAQDQGYRIFVDTENTVKHFVLHPIDIRYFVQWVNYQAAQKEKGAA